MNRLQRIMIRIALFAIAIKPFKSSYDWYEKKELEDKLKELGYYND